MFGFSSAEHSSANAHFCPGPEKCVSTGKEVPPAGYDDTCSNLPHGFMLKYHKTGQNTACGILEAYFCQWQKKMEKPWAVFYRIFF